MDAHHQCSVAFYLAECIYRVVSILFIRQSAGNEKNLPSDLFPVTPEQVTNGKCVYSCLMLVTISCIL